MVIISDTHNWESCGEYETVEILPLNQMFMSHILLQLFSITVKEMTEEIIIGKLSLYTAGQLNI